MTDDAATNDPKGLIREAYRIDGITASECRSIFFDWALSLPADHNTADALKFLLTRYATDAPDHPMTEVLRLGQTEMTTPRRRGGWRPGHATNAILVPKIANNP